MIAYRYKRKGFRYIKQMLGISGEWITLGFNNWQYAEVKAKSTKDSKYYHKTSDWKPKYYSLLDMLFITLRKIGFALTATHK